MQYDSNKIHLKLKFQFHKWFFFKINHLLRTQVINFDHVRSEFFDFIFIYVHFERFSSKANQWKWNECNQIVADFINSSIFSVISVWSGASCIAFTFIDINIGDYFWGVMSNADKIYRYRVKCINNASLLILFSFSISFSISMDLKRVRNKCSLRTILCTWFSKNEPNWTIEVACRLLRNKNELHINRQVEVAYIYLNKFVHWLIHNQVVNWEVLHTHSAQNTSVQ